MPLSMTGYARSILTTKEGRLIGEITSLNKKFFEASLSLPKELFRFEMQLRKRIAERISRGQISLRIFFTFQEKNLSMFLPEISFLKALKKEWEKRAEALNLDKKNIDLSFLANQIKTSSFFEIVKEEEKMEKMLFCCLDKLLASLMLMKKKEGQALVIDIKKRIKEIERRVQTIERLSQGSVPAYREKLLQRVGEYFQHPQDQERILKEVVLFAEKIDITEELVRLHSHCEQFSLLLHTEKEPVGRKLEFLVQEIHREINTIGAKTYLAEISQEVIACKSALEKIREQVQNIE